MVGLFGSWVVGTIVGWAVGATDGWSVGRIVGWSVGVWVVGGMLVAVTGARVGGTRVETTVGAVVAVAASVAVDVGVFEGKRVGDEIFVAVASGLVATTITTRVVGEALGTVAGADCAHAVMFNPIKKNKSERKTFALLEFKSFMRAIVATRSENANGCGTERTLFRSLPARRTLQRTFAAQKFPTASTCLS